MIASRCDWNGATVAVPLALLAVLAGIGRAARGDLDGDGRLTIADAVRLQRALFTPNPGDCGESGSASCKLARRAVVSVCLNRCS